MVNLCRIEKVSKIHVHPLGFLLNLLTEPPVPKKIDMKKNSCWFLGIQDDDI